jgi:hypothetical protein
MLSRWNFVEYEAAVFIRSYIRTITTAAGTDRILILRGWIEPDRGIGDGLAVRVRENTFNATDTENID